MNKIALVIFIYEKANIYFDDLIKSINSQTSTNFEVIIFNDDVKDSYMKFRNLEEKYRVIEIKNETPTRIRFIALKMLSELNFDSYIFQDCDDCLSHNRIEVVTNCLEKYQLVVNDIDIMTEASEIIEHKIWLNRFSVSQIFGYSDIENYNFVGFGNTSITRDLLKFAPKPPIEDIVATDWYFFYSILNKSNIKGYFTSECTTLYRQHIANTIGVAGEDKIQKIIVSKRYHYKLIGLDYKINMFDLGEIVLPYKNKHEYPFWWELNFKKNETN
jgi:glycosyltransferase involved in cell wall biosynthesis